MQGILALVVGPLLLIFAWATYVRAPHRYSDDDGSDCNYYDDDTDDGDYDGDDGDYDGTSRQ